MLRLLLGKDWTANRDVILNRIADDVHQKQGNRILIVPELISHEMERRLCSVAGDTASRYAEVLSFTRLARRVSDIMGSAAQECLDNGGRVVAMAAAARQASSRLKAYAAVETKPEFLMDLVNAVDEFKRCCITSKDLLTASQETNGSLAQKLEELSLLMEMYDSLCAHGKRDPRDQMTWLLEQLEEGSYANEHTFYIDGFPDFTRQNLAIIDCLIQKSPCVTISLNCDQIGSDLLAFEKASSTAQEIYKRAQQHGVEVELEYIQVQNHPLEMVREKLFQGTIHKGSVAQSVLVSQAESPYQECMAAAEYVLDLIGQGCRYRDITVVCTDMETYQPLIDLIFHRFHIPIYRSGTEEILQKSVMSTVLTAMDAAFSGFDQKNTMHYLRSPLSPLQQDTCDLLENYAIIWGIRGQKWFESWKFHPEGLSGKWDAHSYATLNEIENARRIALTPLQHLQQGFRAASSLCEQVRVLYGFLEEISLEKRLMQLSDTLDDAGDNRSAQILNQLWEILISALEQMYDVLGQTHWEPEHFTRLFRLLLSQYNVGTIPPVLDAIQVGPISSMRCHQQKHLILLGAEEGKLPGYSGSSGVLTDQERVALRELGVPLTGGAIEGIQAEFAEIYGVFCGAMESIRVYCSAEQPSFVFRRLAELSGTVTHVKPSTGFARADKWEAGSYLARWSEESLAQKLDLEDGYQETRNRQNYALGNVAFENVKKLYGSTLNLSASQVDRHAECRLSYFLKYGLRSQERKEATVDPAEFGTYVHAVLENTARCIRDMGGFHAVSLDETMEIAHRYSEEYATERFGQLESERMTYLFRRNIQELDMVVEELWNELHASQFEPVDFEVGFGSNDGLPSIDIPNNKIKAILRGFVDRVDTWKTSGSSYYRVVDYKTGKKDFDYCDIFNGVGLQMLLYMFALRNSGSKALGNHPVPAGVQYFPARAPYLSAEGRLDAEAAEKERKIHWKRHGLLLQDEAVLKAMEPGDAPFRMSYTIKKDGSLSGDLADRDQLKILEAYIFKILGRFVEEIASGNISPNPYTRGSSHNACTFCPYGNICHAATIKERRNYKAMKPEKFWEELTKEVTGHGR